MKYVKIAFAITVLAAVLAFVAGNTTPVSLRFLLWETPGVSLSLIAALFFLLGIVFTLLLGVLLRMRRGVRGRQKSGADAVTVSQERTEPAASEETSDSGKEQPSP